MLSETKSDIGNDLRNAAISGLDTDYTRVRLLVAIPAVIVLLLCLMAGVFFWMTEAYIADQLIQQSAALQDFSKDWLLFMAIFIAAGAIIGYFLAWSLTRPIQDIIRLSERVAGGDLKSKLEITRLDEMGQLGSSFNHMVESLNHFIHTRNRFILESFSGGLIVTDLNGTITAINSAAEKLLNVSSEVATGQSIRKIFATPALSDLLRLHERVVWKQEALVDQRFDLEIDGERRALTAGFTSMRDSSGNIFGVIINVRDRLEMERFYEHMRNTDRLATMGTFASGLAHEIRNPLGAIKGTAQLLAEDLGPNHPSSEYLHVITKEVNRLDSLIREVQAYSQPASEKVPADINRLLDEIINLAQADPRLAQKSFQLEKAIDPLPHCYISKDQFRQALLNILLNAMEAVSEEGIVRVTAKSVAGDTLPVQISIANQGPPIPPETEKRIFEPFFTTKAGGTGLGLSISCQIAANHGGKLTVHCPYGWVVFTLLLPDGNGTNA